MSLSRPFLTGSTRLPLTRFFPLTPLLFGRHQLGQPALLPRGRILVDDVLLTGSIQQLDSFGVGCLDCAPCGRAHFLERSAELTPVSSVQGCPGAGLAHALCG